MDKEQGKARVRQIAESLNQMSGKEFLEKAKEALAYCKQNNLLTLKQLNDPDKEKVARLAVLYSTLHKSHQEQPK